LSKKKVIQKACAEEKAAQVKKEEEKKNQKYLHLLCFLYLVFVLLARISSQDTFRPASLTSTLDTYSALLSDFNCVILATLYIAILAPPSIPAVQESSRNHPTLWFVTTSATRCQVTGTLVRPE
jgi:hypothetical protein